MQQFALLATVLLLSIASFLGCKTTDDTSDSGVKSLAEMETSHVNNADGTITVICHRSDDHEALYRETYSREDYRAAVMDDTICSQNGARETGCKTIQGNVFVVRLADDQPLGNSVTPAECERIVSEARLGAVCAADSFGAQLLKVSNGQRIGVSTDPSTCSHQLKGGREGVVCGKRGATFAAHNVAANPMFLIGNLVSLERCIDQVKTAARGLICKPYSESRTVLTRLHDGQSVASVELQFAACEAMIKAARGNTVCTKVAGGGYGKVNVDTLTAYGPTFGTFPDCVATIQP